VAILSDAPGPTIASPARSGRLIRTARRAGSSVAPPLHPPKLFHQV
jgi:hypothetical protein